MLSDRVAIIDRGKIMALDRPGALKAAIGGDLVTVRFSAEDGLEGLLSALRALPGVREVRELRDGIHRIVVERDGDRLIPEVVHLAQEHGIGIHSVRLKRPTLDDVYLHYTGREIREAEGSREELIRTRVMSRRIRR